jgi:glycerol-3-phosphate dehydrogenase
LTSLIEEPTLRFSPEARQQNLEQMNKETFDVLVIGGGITGAGIARDAALRGFKTALIDKDDFGAGTSSKSSKLVHGGFRYLAQLKFGLVHEALTERKVLSRLAPHLVYPLKCVLPIYQGSGFSAPAIQIGMWLYDILAFDRNIARHRMVSAKALHELEPGYRQEGLRKAVKYHDCWGDDFRLVMSTIQSAAQNGVVSGNYVMAVDAIMEHGKIGGVLAKDQLSGREISIKSCVVANATGPWCDQVRQRLLKQKERQVRLTKGVHLIVSREDLPIQHALMQFNIQDGRPIFAIPWKRIVVLGTTDTDYDGDPDQIRVERSDVDYLLESFNYYFPTAHLTNDHVLSAFAGLRPLIFETGKAESQVSREYRIFEGPENFFSIIGGKLTTYRTMAKQMVDRLTRRLAGSFHRIPKNPRCMSHKVPLYGGEIDDYEQFQRKWTSELRGARHFDAEIAAHLVETYGTDVPDLLKEIEKTPNGMDRIHPHLPYVWGELTYAIDHEMALTLDDFLIRRAPLFSWENRQGREVRRDVANRMQDRLAWSAQEKQAQIDRYEFNIKLTEYFREEAPRENTVHR